MAKRSNITLRSELEKVAPGTELREGIDSIISSRTGALIVMGDERNVEVLCNGGVDLDLLFTPQHLVELAKMDGAIILDDDCLHISRANVHLVPDHTLQTNETGMRHRTAERVSRQTKALVISISQRRDVVTLYLGGERIILQDIDVVLAKANQALQTLQRYRTRLDQVLERLTLLEFDDLVTVEDVAEAVSRFEMVRRVADEVSRYITELGSEGRLVRMQAEELTASVDDLYALLLRDYSKDPMPRKVSSLRGRLSKLTPDQFLEPSLVAEELGVSSDSRGAEDRIEARGYRVMRRIPMLPSTVVARIVERFGTVSSILQASEEDLDDIDGVGSRRANAIHEGLRRMKNSLS